MNVTECNIKSLSNEMKYLNILNITVWNNTMN